MAKVKRISINAFEKAVKENNENMITAEWNGLSITINHTIPLQDVMSLVSEVADNCFLEDGRYMPEVMQPLLDCGVVERYTNISLPGNLAARYELVMKSGIVDFIMPLINSNQYNDIVVAIRDRIDYMCDINVTEFRNSIAGMVNSMTELQEKMESLFSVVSPEDVHKLLDAFGDNKAIEERVVDTYIERQKTELTIVGDK